MSSYINWDISDNVPQNDDQLDLNPEFRTVSLWIAHIEWNEMYWRNDWWIDDKNRHFVLLIIDISKHGANEMGHIKMAGPGFVNDFTAWWPGFVLKKIILYCDTTSPQFDDLIKHSRENHPYHCYYCKTTVVLFEEVIKHSTENHGSLMLKVKYLELNPSSGHYGYKSHNFNVIPKKIKALVPVCS
jgi:hypothetical protein